MLFLWMFFVLFAVKASMNLPLCQNEPVPLGTEQTFDCHSPDLHSDLVWLVSTQSPSPTFIEERALCLTQTPTCKGVYPKKRYTVTPHMSQEGSVTSGLTVTKVKKIDHGLRLRCISITRPNSSHPSREFHQLSACEFSVYQKPTNFRCNAEKIGLSKVHISCTTERVFPELVCKLDRVWLDRERKFKTRLSRAEFVYRNASSRGKDNEVLGDEDTKGRHINERAATSCEMYDDIYFRGDYYYNVTAYPDRKYGLNGFQDRASVSSGRLPQSNSPIHVKHTRAKVHLKRAISVDICPWQQDNISVSVWCKAFGFASMPTFTWNHPFNCVENKTFVHVINVKSDTVYENRVTLQLPQPVHRWDGEWVRCRVQHPDHDPTQSVSSIGRVALRWPPDVQPFFTSQNGRDPIEICMYSKKEPLKFLCEVPGGKPAISNISVKCRKKYIGSNKDILEVTKFGTRLPFVVNGSGSESWECTCSAQHPTGCYDKLAKLSILPKDEKVSKAGTDETKDTATLEKTTLIMIIILVLALIVLLVPIFLLVTTKFCCHPNTQKSAVPVPESIPLQQHPKSLPPTPLPAPDFVENSKKTEIHGEYAYILDVLPDVGRESTMKRLSANHDDTEVDEYLSLVPNTPPQRRSSVQTDHDYWYNVDSYFSK